MLTAAFSPAEPLTAPGSDDLGQIFRIITGSKLRDVDEDGNLVEQVVHSPAHQQLFLTEADERREMRNEICLVREEMRDVHRKLDHVCNAIYALGKGEGPPPPPPLQQAPISPPPTNIQVSTSNAPQPVPRPPPLQTQRTVGALNRQMRHSHHGVSTPPPLMQQHSAATLMVPRSK